MFYGGKYDAQDRYDEWNTTQVKLKLNNKTDKDILAWIQKQKYSRSSSVQGVKCYTKVVTGVANKI